MVIQLSESLQQALQVQAAQNQFESVDAYVEAILRRAIEQKPVADETARFLAELLRSGVIDHIPDFSASTEEFEPIKVIGEPVSETIISERR